MHASSAFVFTAIMALARVAIATPPACLIAALGAQSDPSDLTALCGTLEPVVAGNITDLCSGTNEASAISIYSASCLAAGVTVSVETASSSSGSGSASATTTGTSKATGSSTATATASAKASGTATSTATGTSASSTATGTSGAGANTSPQSALILGTLVLGFGFASYLL